MTAYQESQPRHARLESCIEKFMQARWDDGRIMQKNILPRTGISVIFHFSPSMINGAVSPDVALIGFHDRSLTFRALGQRTDCFVIVFSPCGLHRFTATPVHLLNNRVIDGAAVFGEHVHELYDSLRTATTFSARVRLTEACLLKNIREETTIDRMIARMAGRLKNDPDAALWKELKADIPLSSRQLARRFKALTGANIQTYLRMCRFDHAKAGLTEPRLRRLTEIGYSAGYFDQAHFTNEFKKLSLLKPGRFLASSPFYRFISGRPEHGQLS